MQIKNRGLLYVNIHSMKVETGYHEKKRGPFRKAIRVGVSLNLNVMPKNSFINVNITIDTSRLKQNFKNPSTNENSPIAIDHSYQYMVVSQATNITGQGTGDLSFQAQQGDVVRFYATSEYNNYDSPVILCGLFKYGGDDVFKDPNFRLETFPGVETIVPIGFNPLKTQKGSQDFWFAENTVNKKGTEKYGLKFAVYNSDNTLYGFFQWDPTIVCK